MEEITGVEFKKLETKTEVEFKKLETKTEVEFEKLRRANDVRNYLLSAGISALHVLECLEEEIL